MKHRGGFGVTCHNVNEKTGNVAGILSVDDCDDIMIITDAGIIIRTPAKDISTYSRSAAGVIVMRLEEGQSIANITKVVREDEIEEEIEAEESHYAHTYATAEELAEDQDVAMDEQTEMDEE